MRKMGLRAVALAAVLLLMLSACSSVDVGTLVTDGALTVCSDIPYAPFEIEDASAPSGYSGFDIDLMEEIAQKLDLTLKVVVTPFDGIWLQPASGTCDLVASAMTITPDRAANALFSDPYFDAEQSLLVQAAAASTTLADLAGKRIGVQTGTTGEIYATENAPAGSELVSYDEPAAMFLALESGDIDAILQDRPVNEERAKQDDKFVVSATFDTGESYGFAAAAGNTQLMDTINAQLQSLRDEGTFGDLFEQYFGYRP